jgi:hypothetical protein
MLTAMRPTYERDGVVCVLDRSRGFLVVATPEEQVRQDTLDWLIDELQIPATLVRSEFHTARRGGTGRADILVLAPGSTDHDGKTILVVECKRPDVFLEHRAQEQAETYATAVGARYVLLTNGDERVPFARDKGRWRKLAKVPSWREMLKQQGLRWAARPELVREPWSAIDTAAKCRTLIKADGPYEFIVGADTPGYLVPLAFNLFGLLAFEQGLRLPIEDSAIIIQKDLGVRARWFGNAAGGTWPSDFYRSFLVREKATGSHQIVSLAILGGAKNVNDPTFGNTRGMTYLVVAIDDGATSHNSLQLALDKFVPEPQLKMGRVVLRHDGTMTSGKRGRVANDTVLSFVRREAPQLIEDRAVLLGRLPADRLITWNDASDFLLRVVRYALVRDRLRDDLRAKAPTPSAAPACPWKHGDIVRVNFDGEPHEPARFIRQHGKTRAVVHWYDDTFSSIPLADILGPSARAWKLSLEKPNVRFGSADPI